MQFLTLALVFTHWKKLACILGRIMYQEDIKFLYYFGGIGVETKQRAVEAFAAIPEFKVMVNMLTYNREYNRLTIL
jgi:hypothetical protein